MSSRHNIQDATGVVTRHPTKTVAHVAKLTTPTNGVAGFAPGCIWQNLKGSAATSFYLNLGSATSATWQAIGTGVTFSTLTVTTLTATTVVTDAVNMSAAAGVITVKANTQHALEIYDGTTIIADVDTRNTIANVSSVTLTASPPTIATAAAAHVNATLNLAAKTITYTGALTVTSSLGAGLYVDAPTFTDASAGTITTVSNIHVAAVAAAGGSLTITNSYMISTGVSDCYLTNGGVWTDTACWSWGKEKIEDAAGYMIERVIEKLIPRTWNYKQGGPHGNDHGRQRVGIVYDDLPSELMAPGTERGVSAGLLASFSLAAIKHLLGRVQFLEEKLASLEP